MSPRVAITGATGFIGRHAVAHFASRGTEVVAILRPGSRARAPEGVTAVAVPLEPDALASAFRGVATVIHLAGVVSSTRDQDYTIVNVEGTRAVAVAARAAGARLVHISSLAAAGPAPHERPIDEDDPPRPLNAYGRSKLDGERAVAGADGLQWTILRPGVVYGPGDRALLPLFRAAARGIAPRVGRPGAAYTFVHVRDLVRAIDASAGGAALGQTLFVGHPEPVTSRALVHAIGQALGRRVIIVPVPDVVLRALAALGEITGRLRGRPMPIDARRYGELAAEGFVCRVDRLRERLGIDAHINLGEGLRETAGWYRENGWL